MAVSVNLTAPCLPSLLQRQERRLPASGALLPSCPLNPHQRRTFSCFLSCSLKDQLIAAGIITDVIRDVEPIQGLSMSTKFTPGWADFAPYSFTVHPPSTWAGLSVVGLFRWLKSFAGGEVVCCRRSWGTRPFPHHAASAALLCATTLPQNGELLTLDDVADAPTLAIKGARTGDRFVLAVVDPDAPDPVRARLEYGLCGQRLQVAPGHTLAPAFQLLCRCAARPSTLLSHACSPAAQRP